MRRKDEARREFKEALDLNINHLGAKQQLLRMSD
jgi:hypothetical protein